MGEELKGKLQQFNQKKTKEEEAALEKSKFEGSSITSANNTLKKDNNNNINKLLSGLSMKLNTIQKFNLGNDSDHENDEDECCKNQDLLDELLTHDDDLDFPDEIINNNNNNQNYRTKSDNIKDNVSTITSKSKLKIKDKDTEHGITMQNSF